MQSKVAAWWLRAAVEFSHVCGKLMATLVQWPFDCPGWHSVWEPSSPS